MVNISIVIRKHEMKGQATAETGSITCYIPVLPLTQLERGEMSLLLRVLLVSLGWRLFVAASLSVFTSDPVLRARLGYNVTLDCRFSHGRSRGIIFSGHPAVTILWYFYYDHESKLVYSQHVGGAQPSASVQQQHPDYHGRAMVSRRLSARGDASLRLLGVKLADAGLYRCVVMGTIDQAHAETSLEVYAPYQNGKITLGRWKEDVIGTCEFSMGYPQARLEWHYADGTSVDNVDTDAGGMELVSGPEGLFLLRGSLQLHLRGAATICCSWRNGYPQKNCSVCQDIKEMWMAYPKWLGSVTIIFFLLFLATLISCHTGCRKQQEGRKKEQRKFLVRYQLASQWQWAETRKKEENPQRMVSSSSI